MLASFQNQYFRSSIKHKPYDWLCLERRMVYACLIQSDTELFCNCNSRNILRL